MAPSRASGASSALRLLELVGSLTATRELAPLAALERVVREVACGCGADRALVAIHHPQERLIRIDACVGLSEDERRRGYFRPGQGVVGGVVARGQPIADELAGARARGPIDVWPRARSEPGRFVCVPVFARPLGAIAALGLDLRSRGDGRVPEELLLLSVIAGLISGLVVAVREQSEERSERDRERAEQRRRGSSPRSSMLLGDSRAIEEVRALVREVATSSSTVLLLGESGAGKTLAAREIQTRSRRATAPFLTFHCAAPGGQRALGELLERAAGAASEGAWVEDAATVFLDDVAELPIPLQIRLARLLQDGDGARERRQISSALRVIAASPTELEPAVRTGGFHEELYYRLSAFPIHLPPLRERREDIPLLATHFAAGPGRLHAPRALSAEAVSALVRHDWPGNVRELENTIARAALAAESHAIALADLPPELRVLATAREAEAGLKERVAAFERRLIVKALQDARGDRALAAATLRVTPRVLHYQLRRLGIDATEAPGR